MAVSYTQGKAVSLRREKKGAGQVSGFCSRLCYHLAAFLDESFNFFRPPIWKQNNNNKKKQQQQNQTNPQEKKESH